MMAPRFGSPGGGCCSRVCRQSQACLVVVLGAPQGFGRPPLFVAVDYFVGDERLNTLSESGTQRRDLDSGFQSLWIGCMRCWFRCHLTNGIPSPRLNGENSAASAW